MTCAHCVMSVREEASEVPGVRAVDVDLASGRMTVAGRNISAVVADAAVLAELLTPSALEVPRAPGPAAEASPSAPA